MLSGGCPVEAGKQPPFKGVCGTAAPGLHFSGGSHHNRITRATVIGHTVGCIVGENDFGPDRANNDNWIGTLVLKNCSCSALRMAWGTGNRWDRVIVEDCGCALATRPAN